MEGRRVQTPPARQGRQGRRKGGEKATGCGGQAATDGDRGTVDPGIVQAGSEPGWGSLGVVVWWEGGRKGS